MTLEDTARIMDILAAAYPRFYTSSQDKRAAIALWAEMLKDYDVRTVALATKAYIAGDTKGFPPSIGQILAEIRALTEPRELTEDEAWDMVLYALRSSGYNSKREYDKLPPLVQRAVVSPARLHDMAVDPDFNAGVESSNFKRAYRTVCERERQYKALPQDIRALIEQAQTGLAKK